MAFNDLRKRTPCRFDDGLSQQEFASLALKLGKKIKRITKIWVNGAIVYCIVESQKHISEWKFSVDFNDWGHVTGTFWTDSGNYDSSIPHNFGMTLSRWIHEALNEKGIHLREISTGVDSHEDLGKLISTGIYRKRGLVGFVADAFLRNGKQVAVKHSDKDMRGEHLYPIFAQLMDTGFENIRVKAIKDVDEKNDYYEYEVAQVAIDGVTTFEKGKYFDYSAQVVIIYHAKKEITVPFNVESLIRQNYISTEKRLLALGFTAIYERKIKDLIVGILIKDGTTEKVVVEETDGTETPIQNGKAYPYDIHVIVCYHTFK